MLAVAAVQGRDRGLAYSSEARNVCRQVTNEQKEAEVDLSLVVSHERVVDTTSICEAPRKKANPADRDATTTVTVNTPRTSFPARPDTPPARPGGILSL